MTETTLPNLFGEPNSEYLKDTAEAVMDRACDDMDEPNTINRVVRVEEWSAGPITKHLPSARDLVERVAELAGDELDDEAAEALDDGGYDPEVLAAFEAALALWHEKCRPKYRMADRLLRTHVYIIPPSGDYYLQSTEER